MSRAWNIMVYLAGDNSLGEECVFALTEVRRTLAGDNGSGPEQAKSDSPEKIRVVARLDAGGVGGPEPRYLIKIPGRNVDLEGYVVSSPDTSETSYRQVFRDCILSGVREGEDKYYMVVLSGRGSGTDGDFLSKDSPRDALSIPKVRWVFDEVQQQLGGKLGADLRIDISGLDSCLMSMAEVAYELRRHVKYMVGAEGFEPNTGRPVEKILSKLSAEPDMTAEQFAVRIVEEYIKYCQEDLAAGVSVDLAACDLRRCDDLAAVVKNLAAELKGKPDKKRPVTNAVTLAHRRAQSHKNDQYVDLCDFCDALCAELKDGSYDEAEATAVRDACRKVVEIVRGGDGECGAGQNGQNGNNSDPTPKFVLKSCYSGPAVQYSYGLSIYFPRSEVSSDDKELEFAQATGLRRVA